jgi:hypothetical protein
MVPDSSLSWRSRLAPYASLFVLLQSVWAIGLSRFVRGAIGLPSFVQEAHSLVRPYRHYNQYPRKSHETRPTVWEAPIR